MKKKPEFWGFVSGMIIGFALGQAVLAWLGFIILLITVVLALINKAGTKTGFVAGFGLGVLFGSLSGSRLPFSALLQLIF